MYEPLRSAGSALSSLSSRRIFLLFVLRGFVVKVTEVGVLEVVPVFGVEGTVRLRGVEMEGVSGAGSGNRTLFRGGAAATEGAAC